MPKPLAYLQFDANYEHALGKAREQYGKDAIRHIRYAADPRADIKSANAAVWERFVKDFDYCVSNFRSVLVDTTSELLDVRKIAEFGRTTQIMQMYYGGFYADFRWLVKQALDSNACVNFVHRMKKEYKNDQWQGDYVLEGWQGIVYEVQTYVEHDRSDDGTEFVTTIKDCGQDALLMGMSLVNEENNFASLAVRIYPDSEVGDWE